MFTGLVQHLGTIVSSTETPAGRRLVVDASGWEHRPTDGSSIAVDGCCLTVAGNEQGRLAFDVVPQTLRCTTLGRLGPGDRVNLEHAVTPSTLLGGHIVQGHIEAQATVTAIESGAGEFRARFELAPELMRFVIEKGSIALAGVSLTIADCAPEPEGGWFEVALIPTTLEETNLGKLVVGAAVNVETDYLVRAVILRG